MYKVSDVFLGSF